MGILYLLALLVSLTGMVLIDRRFRLFFWAAPRRAAIVLGAGVAFFLVWDLFGIGLGIFFRGETAFMTGLQLAPELPLEEVFFLALLCYLSMNLYRFASLLLARSPLVEEVALRPSRNQAARKSGFETLLRRSSTGEGSEDERG